MESVNPERSALTADRSPHRTPAMVRPPALAQDRSRLRVGLLLLLLVVAALLLAGPAHGLVHHDDHGGHDGHGDPAGDCQLCHVQVGTFEVVELVPAYLGASGSVPPEIIYGPFARTPDRATPPRAPPVV